MRLDKRVGIAEFEPIVRNFEELSVVASIGAEYQVVARCFNKRG
jgi:hypothetical protein